MLRVKIDPRTVMTIQNQIPRIIIAILLITFSYAIAGLMIDLMWLATYTGINTLTDSVYITTSGTNCDNLTLQERAQQNVLDTPIGYANQVLKTDCNWGGLTTTSWNMSVIMSNIVSDFMRQAINGTKGDIQYTCNFTAFFGEIGPRLIPGFWIVDKVKNWYNGKPVTTAPQNDCLTYITTSIISYIISILSVLIVACILLWTLLRIWFELLKAYVMIILYTISAPLWIIMGLLPGKPMGFEKWLRRMFANLAVFPATAMLLTFAAILLNKFDTMPSSQSFVPPLVGSPNIKFFGYLLSFGVLLVTPGLLTILKTSMNAVGKQGAMGSSMIAQVIAGGASIPKGAGRGLGGTVFARPKYKGGAMGPGHNAIMHRLSPRFQKYYRFITGMPEDTTP